MPAFHPVTLTEDELRARRNPTKRAAILVVGLVLLYLCVRTGSAVSPYCCAIPIPDSNAHIVATVGTWLLVVVTAFFSWAGILGAATDDHGWDEAKDVPPALLVALLWGYLAGVFGGIALHFGPYPWNWFGSGYFLMILIGLVPVYRIIYTLGRDMFERVVTTPA